MWNCMGRESRDENVWLYFTIDQQNTLECLTQLPLTDTFNAYFHWDDKDEKSSTQSKSPLCISGETLQKKSGSLSALFTQFTFVGCVHGNPSKLHCFYK